MDALKNAEANLRTVRDVIRLKLRHDYNKDFPTLEETAKDSPAAAADDAKKPKDSAAGKASASPTSRFTANEDREGCRAPHLVRP